MKDIEQVKAHLRSQFERGRPILFTGAGFSSTCKSVSGDNLPVGTTLAKTLWSICFPSEPFDDGASLQDIYEAALSKDPRALKETLSRQLTVDPASVDERIVRYFTFPWHRIYTLNVDNLPDAVSRGFTLPRPLATVSLSNVGTNDDRRSAFQALPVIHLNGLMSDGPDKITFAATQYAKRLAFPDHLYLELVADIVSRPVVFIGTKLDEPSLWQHVEIRKARGTRDIREMRPGSYLVSPVLDRARASRLSEFNITWLQMTAEEFSEKVLKELTDARDAGLKLFKSGRDESGHAPQLAEVGTLATDPHRHSEFLLGQEPIWADIQSNRAIERACDKEFSETFTRLRAEKDKPRILMIAGTAGAGKSTCLMRLALRAAAQGDHVGWVDRDNELSPRDIISAMREEKGPSVLAIDDADIFGTSLSPMLYDIATEDRKPLVMIALRSGVIDRVIDSLLLKGVNIGEINVPHLTDGDIESLLDVLDRENRLGALKGKSRDQQCAKFREYAGRQLLVAMFSATSGEKLQDKAPSEFFDLPHGLQRVYAVICLSTTLRYRLTRQEILLALNDSTNEALNDIDTLVRRHIVAETTGGSIQARHRVIAEMIRDELLKRGQIADPIFGLAFMAATHKHSGVSRRHRANGLLRSLTNHDFLYRNLDLPRAQLLYQNLEDLLADDAHYWLQRGSLEVEFGDIRIAENFLNQARGLSPRDLYIDNEWAYLLFKKAHQNPRSTAATDYVAEATSTIEAIIQNPKAGPYPYHVLGSQGLAWSRVGIPSDEEKARYLNGLRTVVDSGVARYPKNNELRKLKEDLMREYLSLALSPPRS
ncbi:hypothetical protein [Nitrospira moscoviensis]|uniref:P-loop NTPase n=1 Tax=Nitrospira moscoviensis TaxID=42253 RepID=UPI0011AEAA97|nr:hypothetical protein [Nitrospira moscoviensis]